MPGFRVACHARGESGLRTFGPWEVARDGDRLMSRARAVERHIANSSDLAGLIALGEGFTTESKQSGISNLGREICAFANATGGVILVGVPDGGGITGVPDHNALKSRVESIARSADPAIAVEMASVDNVLCVTVPDQHGKPYSFGGRFFLRVGATCQQMSRDEIREFFFREGLIRRGTLPEVQLESGSVT